MTQLLVSVRDANEAQAALAGGAALIDVKEPRRGSLGRATAAALWEVREAVGEAAPLSAALGELCDEVDDAALAALAGYRFAKVGLAGAAALDDWPQRWANLTRRLPRGAAPVGVVYADGPACGAPDHAEILAHAIALGCGAMLLDTFVKERRGLLDVWPLDRVARFVDAAHRGKMACVLAGSLTLQTASRAAELAPDFIAVRSAVCAGGRSGCVQQELVAALAGSLRRMDRQRALA